jgi:hypothetical protein
MSGIILHPQTHAAIERYGAQPGHATILIGSHGIGKTYVAEHMVAGVLDMAPAALAQYPYYLHIAPDGTSISIDAIRTLQRFLQLKTLGNTRQLRRAIIVEHADALTTEAQNAFLKILEEPPRDTILILTANSQHTLLPTILSRAQPVMVPIPAEADSKAYFASHGDATTINQAYFLSGGRPGLMQALLADDKTHPLMQGVATAKAILQAKLFERLTMVEALSKNKEAAGYVLEALCHIAQASIAGATAKADDAKLKQWHRILKATQEAREALQINANPKLTLTNYMLTL